MRRLSLLALLVTLACGRDSADGALGGTVIIAAAADADAMLPQLVHSSQGRLASELLFDPLVEIGPSLNTIGDRDFQPRLAERWSWSADSLAITFFLRRDATWHDGRPVTAADVQAGIAAALEPANGASSRVTISTVDSATASDAGTVTLHFSVRSAEQFYVASQIFPLPSHLLPTDGSLLGTSALARNPIGNGPYRFVEWRPLERLELAAVEDFYRGRAGLDRVVLTVAPEPATGLARIWAGDADVWELVPAGDVAEAQQHPHVRLVLSNAFDYGYVAFNFRDARDRERAHPLFTNRALRRAILMAVDRDGMVRAVLDTLAVPLRGPFVRAQFTADTTIPQIPFDRAAAAASLDSLGWRVDARDGIRRRNGQRLAFTALVPGSSRNRERGAVVLQEQLRQVGIALEIERAENRTFTEKRQTGRFDVVFGGWLTTPSPFSLRGTWGSVGEEGWGSLNDGRYSNPLFDAALRAGIAALNPDDTKRHFREAYETVVQDAAAIFLYESRSVAAVHRRFIIPAWRPDGWWRSIPEWRVDPAQRLPRDARPTAN